MVLLNFYYTIFMSFITDLFFNNFVTVKACFFLWQLKLPTVILCYRLLVVQISVGNFCILNNFGMFFMPFLSPLSFRRIMVQCANKEIQRSSETERNTTFTVRYISRIVPAEQGNWSPDVKARFEHREAESQYARMHAITPQQIARGSLFRHRIHV